jgi:hypothetical protein
VALPDPVEERLRHQRQRYLRRGRTDLDR